MTPSLSSATAESTGWKEARDPKKPKNCTHIVHILFLNGAADLNQEWTFFDNHTFCMVMATGANAHIAQPGGGEGAQGGDRFLRATDGGAGAPGYGRLFAI